VAVVLAAIVALSLPSAAGADHEGRHGGGRSSERERGNDQHGDSRGGGRTRSDPGTRAWGGTPDRTYGGPVARGDVRYRDPRGDGRYRQPQWDGRGDARWDSRGARRYEPSYGYRVRSRDPGRDRARYRPRPYYTSFFSRPHFVPRTGLSIGFGIGSAPPYGCCFYDPYCDIGFSSLDEYYDHCDGYDHPEVILMLDVRSGNPIATCRYDNGGWVIDDCY
jgi:hypothetical protein